MTTRSRRVRPRCVRLLLSAVAPLLLLVPLGVLKWRADWRAEHPPVTSPDRILRRAIEHGSQLYIVGDMRWRELSGLQYSQGFLVKDRSTMEHLTNVLRCSEKSSSGSLDRIEVSLTFGILTQDPKTHRPQWIRFEYWRNASGSYLASDGNRQLAGVWNEYLVVEPRFAPRFEAWVAQLAQRVKAKGSHPEIVLQRIPWYNY